MSAWFVTRVVCERVAPYADDDPYSTKESAGSSVCHEMATEVDPPLDATALITGGVVSAGGGGGGSGGGGGGAGGGGGDAGG